MPGGSSRDAADARTPTAQRESEYFDRLVDDHGDFNPFTDRGWRTLERRFAGVVGNARVARLLDVGCGTGNSHRIYASRASQYLGIDLSQAALRTAAAQHRDARWLRADGTRLPFPSGVFDAVAFSSVLHHMPDPRAALEDAARVLRPGGLVFAFDPNLLHPAMLLFRHPSSPLYSPEGVSPNEQPMHPAVLRQHFENAGLEAIGQRCQSDLPYRQVAPRLLNRLLPAYNLLDRLWEYSGAARWMGTFVVTWARTPGR